MNKKDYEVCCYTCQHNGQETCQGCITFLNGENEPYGNWRLREDLEAKDQRITELEEQLENAIVPKFKVGQTVWIVYDSIQSIPSECVIDKIVYDTSNLSKLLYYTKDEISWISLEKDIFATKEEAEARLRELKENEKSS